MCEFECDGWWEQGEGRFVSIMEYLRRASTGIVIYQYRLLHHYSREFALCCAPCAHCFCPPPTPRATPRAHAPPPMALPYAPKLVATSSSIKNSWLDVPLWNALAMNVSVTHKNQGWSTTNVFLLITAISSWDNDIIFFVHIS
jgi:hypothetical protein